MKDHRTFKLTTYTSQMNHHLCELNVLLGVNMHFNRKSRIPTFQPLFEHSDVWIKYTIYHFLF